MILLLLVLYVHSAAASPRIDASVPPTYTIELRNDVGSSTRAAGAASLHPAAALRKLDNSSVSNHTINLTFNFNSSAYFKKATDYARDNTEQAISGLNVDPGSLPNTDAASLPVALALLKNGRTVGQDTTNPPHSLTILKKSGKQNVNGPLNALSFLQRSKRQASLVVNSSRPDPETMELPHFPGIPFDSRRAKPSKYAARAMIAVKRKILNMMLQSLYSVQERLWPMEPVVKIYENLTPYRMAFIFLKLDQLVHEAHSINLYLHRQDKNEAMTMTRRLQMYSHLLRRNIDVTYLVDYISERVPRDQLVRVRQFVIRKEQEESIKRQIEYDKTTPRLIGRPDRECTVLGYCPAPYNGG